MTIIIELVKDPSETAMAVSGVSAEAFADHPLHDVLTHAGFKAEVGDSLVVPGDDGGAAIVVGLGSTEDRTVDSFRVIGGAIARAGAKQEALSVRGVVEDLGELPPAPVAQALAEGLVLGAYRYTVLKSDPKPSQIRTVEIVGKGGKRVQTALDLGRAIAEAVCITRDLVNEPGGTLTPPALAKKTEQLGAAHGFEVTVLGPKEIKAAKMGGLLGVNRGSEIPPRFLELSWKPEGKPRGVVALVGKGVTFDSGGLSLKPSDGMIGMKGDMGGGAAVIGAFCALQAASPRVEVRGYVPLTDNMTGGDATRLGDVLTISNGKTVEIHNTDAEGRLILADALSKATTDEPDAIVDLATLTGACMVALGDNHAGVMGNSAAWIEQVQEAATSAGEKTWHLPLPPEWRANLDSDIADMKNIGGRYGGASIAGLFLKEFVGEDIPWVHIDIAGPAFVDKESTTETKGGTGYGVRTLISLLKSYKRPRL
ncbi:leucyl aminopeptidase [Actinospongicola halichondriae]|uniref:leucyl aminopeptidase n=1 Tax=Actinospongicola halichondriae TaxID=3236844 RepID=UPI003D555DFF